MRYFFVHRALPGPNYKYAPRIQYWEKLTETQLKSINIVDKPIRLGHDDGIDIGKVMFEWEGDDKSKFALSYIDSDTPNGAKAIQLVKSGVIRSTSPKYKMGLTYGPGKLLIDKEYQEIALVENPDFPGVGGCNIFFGADEDDLNIKSYSLLKNIGAQESNKQHDIAERVKSLIDDINQKSSGTMSNPVVETPQQTQQAQQPQQGQQQQQQGQQQGQQQTPQQVLNQPPAPNQVQIPVEKVEGGVTKINSVDDLVTAVNDDPKLAEEMDQDTVRKLFLRVSKEYSDRVKRLAPDQGVKRTAPDQEDDASKRRAVEANSAQHPSQSKPQQYPNANILAENATKMALQRVDYLVNLLKNTNNLNAVGPMVNQEAIKNTVQNIGEAVSKYPENPLVPTLMNGLEQMGTFIMAHAYNTYTNELGRAAVKNVERTITMGEIQNFMKNDDKQSSNQTTTYQHSNTTIQTQDKKYDMSEFERNVSNVVNSVLKKGSSGYGMPLIPIKMEHVRQNYE